MRELAADRCFDCYGTVDSAPAQIDHFVAWTRHVDTGLANLVFAHASRNNPKRAYLAAEAHVEHWVHQLLEPAYARGLVDLAGEQDRDHDPASSVAAARGIYLALHDGYPLWQERGVFTPASRDRLAAALNVVPLARTLGTAVSPAWSSPRALVPNRVERCWPCTPARATPSAQAST